MEAFQCLNQRSNDSFYLALLLMVLLQKIELLTLFINLFIHQGVGARFFRRSFGITFEYSFAYTLRNVKYCFTFE